MTEDKLIRVLSSSYFWPGADRDDVAQEARYALERARRRYTPDKGCSWLSFAWVCVKAHLIEQVRRETKRRVQFAVLSEPHASYVDTHEVAESRETLRLVTEIPLTDLERCALGRAIRGEPVKHPKAIENALQRARKKLRAAA